MTIPFVAALAAYLLGSVNGSLVLGRLKGGVDIRTLGSGNAGGTNALRTQGKAFALGVVLIDIGKGWVATALLPAIALRAAGTGTALADLELARLWAPLACGLAAILGHVFPLWHGFRGGKGAATLVGALAGIAPVLLAPVLGVWILCLVATGFVGLATVLAAATLPLAAVALDIEPRGPTLAFALAAALVIVYTHRGNLARMRARTEPRARLPWLRRA